MKLLRSICTSILMIAVVFSFGFSMPDRFDTQVFAAESSSYNLDDKTVTVYVGESVKQKLYNSEGKTVKASKITWKSSNSSIAKVSSEGKITGVKTGKTKMSAKYKGKTYSFTVNVKSSAIKLSKSKVKFSSDSKSAKVKITTAYSGVYYQVLSGNSAVSCSWAKNWNGNSIYLNIKCKEPGSAKIKVYPTGYPKKSRIITVSYDRGYSVCYEEDNYKIGKNMPAGEYVVFSNSDSGYVCISEDSNQDKIIENENFEYNTIIQVRNGDYLELSRCYAVPIKDAKVSLKKVGAMYKVGYHIAEGEYTLKNESDGIGAYYAVLKGPIGSLRDSDVVKYNGTTYSGYLSNIINNDNFKGSRAYVTVSNGQYLQLSRCKGTDFKKPDKKISLDTVAGYTADLPKNTKFEVVLPTIPYSVSESLLYKLDGKIKELETEKLYDKKTGKYSFSCTAYGYVNYTGLHMCTMTLYNSKGEEVKTANELYSQEGRYTEYRSIDLKLLAENLDEDTYTLKVEIL